MDNYHVLDLIGEGSFGKVYKGRRKFCGQTVALKFIPKGNKTKKDIKALRQARAHAPSPSAGRPHPAPRRATRPARVTVSAPPARTRAPDPPRRAARAPRRRARAGD